MITVQKGKSGINWVTKSKAYSRSGDDVSINVTKSKATNKRDAKVAAITFRNKCYVKFDTGYIKMGIAGARLYFMTADKNDGYKLTDPTGSYSRYAKCGDPTLVDWCASHKGDYSLLFDTDENLWYIEDRRGN